MCVYGAWRKIMVRENNSRILTDNFTDIAEYAYYLDYAWIVIYLYSIYCVTLAAINFKAHNLVEMYDPLVKYFKCNNKEVTLTPIQLLI